MNFKAKLSGGMFLLILAGVSGTTAFLINLYRDDKVNSIYSAELSNAQRAASHLNNLMMLGDVIELSQVKKSNELIFIHERPCDIQSYGKGVVSNIYRKKLKDAGYDTQDWIESIELNQFCKNLKSQTNRFSVVASEIQIMVPYILAYIRRLGGDRLVMVSMDGFKTSAANTLFLLNRDAQVIWAADGKKYFQGAASDSGLKTDFGKDIIAKESEIPSSVFQAGTDGLISYARAANDWILGSLSYRPTAMQPVRFALQQTLYLTAGFLFLSFLIGRLTAKWLARPLSELQSAADRIGSGDFESQLEVTGQDEFSAVKTAINTMSHRISELVEHEKEKASLEVELQLAQKVQRMLMPETEVRVKGLDIFSTNTTASQCGGDWWGHFEIPREGKSPLTALMIGDVTGHGAGAALVAAVVKGGLYHLARKAKRGQFEFAYPSEVNDYFNQLVCDVSMNELSMTFFTLFIDSDADEVVYSNAGHSFPYMVNPKEGKVLHPLVLPGIPLGQSRDSEYMDKTIEFRKGSKIILYTDGLIETFVGEEEIFKKRDLTRLLQENKLMNAKALLEKVLDSRSAALAQRPEYVEHDDVTTIVCENRESQQVDHEAA